jgi:hypothetical protein
MMVGELVLAKDKSHVDSKSRACHPVPAFSAHGTVPFRMVDDGVFAAAKRPVQ